MIRILKKRIKSIITNLKKIRDVTFFFPYKGFNKIDLLIIDNIFPHPVSGFRIEEFTVLLTQIKSSKILLTNTSYGSVNTPKSMHNMHIVEYEKLHPLNKNKLQLKKGFVNVKANLAYCVFLKIIFENIEWIEKNKIPFVFTLYPGGGFQIENEVSDFKLKRVLSSPMFKHVIVTQPYTEQYLLNNGFCKQKDIKLIPGGVVPQISLNKDMSNKEMYLLNKQTFDICFCAAKYMPRGEDKGYDVFIEFAHILSLKYEFVKFHIIGGFSKNDINVDLIDDKIHFYGYQKFEDLSTIFQKMDVLISPNKPFLLGKGAFDGFPLGTAVEAALNGVVVLLSDELKQNTTFIPNEEIIIIESNSQSIEKEIIDLITHPNKLYVISNKGRHKFLKVYSNDIQMKPRIELLKNEIINVTND